MARYMTVRVVDSSGRPKQGARVGVQVHRFLAGGFKSDQYTDADGTTEFELSDDSRVTLYVNGSRMEPSEREPQALVRLVV
jgi:hypothetical protein